MLFDNVDKAQQVAVFLPEGTFAEAALCVQEGLLGSVNIHFLDL